MSSEPPPSSPPPPTQVPAEGWYQDPSGTGLRWWDGAGWTEHVHDAVAPTTPTAEATPANGDATPFIPTAATGSSATSSSLSDAMGENRRLLVLLAILVVALIAGLLVLTGGDDADEPTGTPVQQKAADADSKVAVKTAQTAVETYATDNAGSYAKATPPRLVQIEPTLEGSTLAVTSDKTSYSVSVTTASTGNVFTIIRELNGSTALTCTTAGTGGCPSTGAWG